MPIDQRSTVNFRPAPRHLLLTIGSLWRISSRAGGPCRTAPRFAPHPDNQINIGTFALRSRGLRAPTPGWRVAAAGEHFFRKDTGLLMAFEDGRVHATGKVKFFNEPKGYGFFTREDGAGDVFVHRSDLPAEAGLLYEGRSVTFDIERTTRGLRAINIKLA
jgi:CspA family cold shock protein